MKIKTNNKGFTLIELLSTVIILLIIFLIGRMIVGGIVERVYTDACIANKRSMVQSTAGTVMARSIKESTGLEIEVSKDNPIPNDVLSPEAYDGDESTVTQVFQKYLKIHSSLSNHEIRMRWLSNSKIPAIARFLDNDRELISEINTLGLSDTTYLIPPGTTWM